jgi:hypothetical protein
VVSDLLYRLINLAFGRADANPEDEMTKKKPENESKNHDGTDVVSHVSHGGATGDHGHDDGGSNDADAERRRLDAEEAERARVEAEAKARAEELRRSGTKPAAGKRAADKPAGNCPACHGEGHARLYSPDVLPEDLRALIDYRQTETLRTSDEECPVCLGTGAVSDPAAVTPTDLLYIQQADHAKHPEEA